MDSDVENVNHWIVDDALWDRLVELTNGAASVCYQCGVCTATCPWGALGSDAPSIRLAVRRAQVGVLDDLDDLWLCTSCAQCEAQCPRGVSVADVIGGLRGLMWERRQIPNGLPSVLWSVFWNNNPWFQPPSQRAQWAKDVEAAAYDPGQHEVLYYVGCTSSYDRRAQNIALSLVKIFEASGVRLGVLGDEEPCCGEAVLSLGHRDYFEELAQKAAKVFGEKQVGKLVSVSPHCFDVFRNHLPNLDGSFEPLHYTQFLADMIEEGRLGFESGEEVKVTFQDPCFLGRRNGIYDAPRQVLQAIPGLNLVEMEDNGPEALCCGGGGGRMWMETPTAVRFSDIRAEQAAETGADILATACPFCLSCLEDGLKSHGLTHIKVLDVAEIAAGFLPRDCGERLDGGEGSEE